MNLFKKYRLLFIFGFPLILILLGASFLGENHRSLNLVDEYFTSLQERDFSKVCIDMNWGEQAPQNKLKPLSCAQQNFLLYLSLGALLDIGYEAFNVKLSIKNYWLPLFTHPELSVNVTIQSPTTTVNLEDFISAKRNGMAWSLERINISNSRLRSIFLKFQREINFDKYMVSTRGSIKFNSNETDISELTSTEKQLLLHSLKNAIKDIE